VQKSADAFRTISEVATELDVPQHVLRFWESKFTQIKPLKRAGGRRYYRPTDIDLLRGIRVLLYSDGYTIKGVQKVLKDRGARFVTDAGAGKRGPDAVASVTEEDAAQTASRATARRKRSPDPREMPLPLAFPEMLNPHAPVVTSTLPRAAEPPRMTPAQRRKLEKIMNELVAARRLLKGE